MSDMVLKITDRQGNIHELSFPKQDDLYLLDFIEKNNIEIEGDCGGICECAGCHVYVTNTESTEVDFIEEMMIEELPNKKETSRLSCQIKLNESCQGMEVQIAPK